MKSCLFLPSTSRIKRIPRYIPLPQPINRWQNILGSFPPKNYEFFGNIKPAKKRPPVLERRRVRTRKGLLVNEIHCKVITAFDGVHSSVIKVQHQSIGMGTGTNANASDTFIILLNKVVLDEIMIPLAIIEN